MSDDKIAEIRARHDAVHNVLRGASQMHDDRGYLLAEFERLTRERDAARAEIERSQAESANNDCLLDRVGRLQGLLEDISRDMVEAVVRLTRERDEARAEVEKLRAENARLRAQIAEYFTEPATHPVEEP